MSSKMPHECLIGLTSYQGPLIFYEEVSGRPAKKLGCIKGGVAPMKEFVIVQNISTRMG